MTILRIALALTLLVESVSRAGAVELRLLAEGLTAPIGIADPDDGTGRLFVLEQQGVVQILDASGTLSTPLLDLSARLVPLDEGFEERGLLGFALHPEFARNGRVYVSYAAPLRAGAPRGWNYTRRISELTLTPGATTIDLGSERILIELDWPSRKHNGGGLGFGPDGYRIEDPVVEYPNMQVMDPQTKVDAEGLGTAVVGARLYRGAAIPALAGKLVFADWSADFSAPSGQLFVATPAQNWGEVWPFERLATLDTRIVSLDTDAVGEIYVLTNDQLGPFGATGKVFKLVP